MSKPHSQPFDVDEWMLLAKSDPEEFERRRREAIEDLISKAPEDTQGRLRCLQWRIDMERRRCKNPLQSCVRLSQMMWDFVFAENGFLNALETLDGSSSLMTVSAKRAKPAKVLPFKP